MGLHLSPTGDAEQHTDITVAMVCLGILGSYAGANQASHADTRDDIMILFGQSRSILAVKE